MNASRQGAEDVQSDRARDGGMSSGIGGLISTPAGIPPTFRVRETADLFFADADVDALAVVRDGSPVGLVTRGKLMFQLFRRFGFELYGRHAVIDIAVRDPLVVSECERADVIIDQALERAPEDIYDEIIVVDKTGAYRGLLSMRQLVLRQSDALSQSLVQREMATQRARELERMNEMKSQFMAHVTHELRSPVNVIIGLAELMRISLDRGNMDQVRDRLSSIIANASHLRTTVTNVLDLSKLEADRMTIAVQPFDLLEVVNAAAESARVLVRKKPVIVEVMTAQAPAMIESDPVKVKQILLNLASNAAKFTEQGRIIISVTALKRTVNISVIDSGIGIVPEHLSRLFAAFSQIEDAKTKRHSGTGLGLLIARNMARLLGGELTVTSTYGKGSTFTLTLPIEHLQKGTNAHAEQTQEDHDHRR